MTTQEQKYHQAAITYLIYGIIYLSGAIYLAKVGVAERTMSPGGGIWWFIFGAILILIFPPLIWKGFKWFTRILAVLVVIRIIGIVRVIINDAGMMVPTPWGSELSMLYGAVAFLIIAAVACFMLARAGWDF